MNNFENHFNIDDLIAHSININIDDAILSNNIEEENSLYNYVKLEPSEFEECPVNDNYYLKVECSFSKHYNGIGQNIKAYVTILNDCFEELNNVKCIISSENYFNTYSFIINSIQINEVIVKEVNLTIYDKYLNSDQYDPYFENEKGNLIDNLVDNLPSNISIRLVDENQGGVLPSYPSSFNVTSDFFIKDFLKINETNEIFNVMILGPSLETSNNLTNSLKLLFENYDINKINFTNNDTIKKSFSEKYLDNEQWPLNIRIFYNKNFNHINTQDNIDVLKFIINGFFPDDDSILHLTEKKNFDYNKNWNLVETCQLDKYIESIKSNDLYNNILPKNNKQYINAIIILVPKIANTNPTVLQTYKDIADLIVKQGRPTYIVLDNFMNNTASESSLTDVNDSKEDINFMNIINDFSLYPIYTTSSYELIKVNDDNDNEYDYDPIAIKKFKKHMNRDILLLHMMNKLTKDLIDINCSQKMLINPDTENIDVLVILYWNKDYDQNISLIPTVIGECYSKNNSNRMALITNINPRLNIDFTNNRLDFFKEISSLDVDSLNFENDDFKTVLDHAESLLKQSNSHNSWNTWIVTNTEISSSDVKIVETELIEKSTDKIFFVDIRDTQEIANCRNDSLELENTNLKRFLSVENIDSLIEYFAKNTKKNNNLVINPRLTLK